MQAEVHPVIHHRDIATTLRNAEIAQQNRCAGIFLIHMDGMDHLLDVAIQAVRREFPKLPVGVNRLNTEVNESIRQNADLGAANTWSDHCGVTSKGADELGISIQNTIYLLPKHQFFGSVAFKYQEFESDPRKAAHEARLIGFIPTTSGPATGVAPEVEKIAAMASGLSQKSLAIASGITPGNATAFLPYASHLLVSTGISSSFHEFDAAKLEALMRAVRGEKLA